MRTYTMKKIQGAPDWSATPVMPIDNLLWTDSIDITAQAQICWDENALYVRMEAVEPHIRVEEDGPLAMVCEDSCMEFFLRPTEQMKYFNIEINPNKAIYLGITAGRPMLIRLLSGEIKEQMNIQVEMTDKGWVLSYQVPFSVINFFFPEFKAEAGGKIYGNAYKCGDKTAKEHYMAWNPVCSEEPDFHLPEQFGTLIFGE